MSQSERSDLGVNRQRVQFVLLLSLGGSVEGPGDFGNGSPGDGGGNPDGGSRSAVQQIVSAHIERHRRLD